MNCPKCSNQMGIKRIDDVEINICNTCSGIWFDQGELRKAKDKYDSDLNWMDFEIWKHEDKFKFSQKSIQCPKCNIDMVKIDYAATKVEIDYCPKCQGAWLDEGEFKNIIECLNFELANKSISDYVKASLEEGLEIVKGPETFIAEWKDFMTILRMFQYRLLIVNPKLQDTLIAFQAKFPIK